jgi:hypothetical protein
MSQKEAQAYRQELVNRQVQSEQRKLPLSADQVAALTLADVDAYSSDEYLVHLKTNPVFVARVDELEKTRKPRPSSR